MLLIDFHFSSPSQASYGSCLLVFTHAFIKCPQSKRAAFARTRLKNWQCIRNAVFQNLIAYSPFFVSCLCLLKFNLDHTLEFFRVQSYSMTIAPNQMSWLSPIKKATEKMVVSFFTEIFSWKTLFFVFHKKSSDWTISIFFRKTFLFKMFIRKRRNVDFMVRIISMA